MGKSTLKDQKLQRLPLISGAKAAYIVESMAERALAIPKACKQGLRESIDYGRC